MPRTAVKQPRKLPELLQLSLLLGERLETSNEVKLACWKIWKHCRLNSDSMNSERECALIEKVVSSAVATTQLRLEDAVATQHELKDELAQVKQIGKELKRNNEMLKQNADLMSKAMDSLKQKMVALNNSIDEAFGEVESMKERMK